MNTLQVRYLIRKLEPAIVVLLFLSSMNLNLPVFAENIMRKVSYLLVAFLVVNAGIGQWQHFAYVVTRDMFPWILAGLSLVSAIWSASPLNTLDEVAPLIRTCIFGGYLALRYSPKEHMRLIAWTIGIVVILSFLVVILIPSYGTTIHDGKFVWLGIFDHKQSVARFISIGAITFLNFAFNKKKSKLQPWILALFLLSVIFLVLSKSRSGLILLIMPICLLPYFRSLVQKYRQRVVLIITLILISSASIFLILSNIETIVVDLLGKDLQFTGRTPIWSLVIEKGLERPWLGYGYAGFWNSSESDLIIKSTWLNHMLIESEGIKTGIHAHNGFVDLFVELGVVGLFFTVLSLTFLFYRTLFLLAETKNQEWSWVLQVLVIVFLTGFGESKILIHRSLMWIFYVSMCFSTGVWYKRIQKTRVAK